MRLAVIKVAVAGDVLPMPDRPLPNGRFDVLPAEGREVDVEQPFWAACLRDGSVVEVQPDPPSAAPADKPSAKSAPATKD